MKKDGGRRTEIASRDELGASLARRQDLERVRDRLALTLDKRIAELRQAFSADTASIDEHIALETAAEIAFLEEHKAEFAGSPRSWDFPAGQVGFRFGKPTIKPLAKTTWEKVLAILESLRMERFIRRGAAPDREALLAAYGDLGDEGLKQFGLRLDQQDRPFVDIHREQPALQEAGQ